MSKTIFVSSKFICVPVELSIGSVTFEPVGVMFVSATCEAV